MKESRLHKSLLNARVNLIFYFITLFLSFFSRKIFLDKLGDDFVGLTSTISNLLDFLNLAELGIGSAIGVVLYKPLFEADKTKINEIISVFGYFYHRIGLCILAGGIALSAFLPWIFGKTEFPVGLIFFAFYSFLTSSLIGYFANYKQTLLGADQRNYVVTAYFQTSNLFKTIIQMALAYYTRNYYLWVAIELCFGIIYSIILNWKIRQVYPWLAADLKSGKRLKQKYPLIMNYAKQLFVHKIGSLVQFQIKPLLIYAFVSLQIVAFYGNYTLIIDKLALLIRNLLGSTGAGVGNLIAEGNETQIKRVFWELIALNYFIAGVLVFSVYYLIEPFITLWVGPEYILSRPVLILILANMFIMQTRGTVDQFLYGYGLFSDIWAPIAETIASLSIALAGGYYWGLSGILLGSVVSMLFIVTLWKPYFLYNKGFHSRIWLYWKEILKITLLIILSWIITHLYITSVVTIQPDKSYWSWILYALAIVPVFGVLSFALMYMFCPGLKTCVTRIKSSIFKKQL